MFNGLMIELRLNSRRKGETKMFERRRELIIRYKRGKRLPESHEKESLETEMGKVEARWQ
jgi:hypothetical protein